VALTFDMARFRIGDEVDFVVRFTSLHEALGTRVRIETSGIVAVSGWHEFTWDRLRGNDTRMFESRFQLEREGMGNSARSSMYSTRPAPSATAGPHRRTS
jgi:hypothetical protein